MLRPAVTAPARPEGEARPRLSHSSWAGAEKGSAAAGWGDSNSSPPPAGVPGCGLMALLTWSSARPLLTADARNAPQATERACTYRVEVASAQPQRLVLQPHLA
jgi:hypothetical protein